MRRSVINRFVDFLVFKLRNEKGEMAIYIYMYNVNKEAPNLVSLQSTMCHTQCVRHLRDPPLCNYFL